MECLRGKHRVELGPADLAVCLAAARHVLVDLGTGDGRYVLQIAATQPEMFAIGVDACRENLRVASRHAPVNALYVIACAEALPAELAGLAHHITINFPWGSLQRGLLTGDPALVRGLRAISRPGASLEIRVNGGALAEQGWTLESGADQIGRMLLSAGFLMRLPELLDRAALRECPSSWARRLAFGRDPRGILLGGLFPPDEPARVA